MRDLTFFTSNPTKLAHARYIAEGRPIKIKGFRQRTYHANYNEPRLSSREELLDASYRSALSQCTKAGISIDVHPFILEDTSVRIEALSGSEIDYPGLDVKFWIQGQTFRALDCALKSAGNLRTASVRSDVLLHIPRSLKTAWGIDNDYVIFVGVQQGTIVHEEMSFEPNLVFPWLDNQSFNKWFVPIGHRIPFGALAITEANGVDFRRKSFEKLFSFLDSRNYVTQEVRQLELALEQKPNFIICGYTCAGKTTASQYLATHFGYLHIEASDFMYLSYFYRHGYRGPIAIGDFAEKALSAKPDIAAEKIAEYVTENLATPIIISGFRARAEIQCLIKALSIYGKEFRTLFVTADEITRFKRLRARMRPGDDITLDSFRARDAQQERMGLEAIRNYEASAFVANEGTLQEYLNVIDAQVGLALQDEIDVSVALPHLAAMSQVKLEDSILIALLTVWATDESRPFFTTTEIAGIIKRVFVKVQPKHKDNVSRYFNQDFYAYFEISTADGSKTRKYRLSNTGYGMAVNALRKLLRTD